MAMAMTSYEMPTKLKATTSDYAVVSPDKLSLKSTGASFENMVVVQANKAVPVNLDSGYYYFEMRVKNAGSSQTRAAIGYSEEGFTSSNLLGYDASVGYHGDDGKLYAAGRSVTSCPQFTTNDIVGAGINYTSKQIFFTKNGELVGTVSKNLDGPLFPSVNVFDLDVELKVNFGHKPFAYDDIVIRSSYPCPYWHQPTINDDPRSSVTKVDGGNDSMVNVDSCSFNSTKGECWKTLMKMCESSLRKSIKEKENEVASLKSVMKDLEKHL